MIAICSRSRSRIWKGVLDQHTGHEGHKGNRIKQAAREKQALKPDATEEGIYYDVAASPAPRLATTVR